MRAKLLTDDVVDRVSSQMMCYKKDCRQLLTLFADLVTEELIAGRSVYFKPLGTFHPVAGRSGKRRVRFVPARRLRLALAGKGRGEAGLDEASS